MAEIDDVRALKTNWLYCLLVQVRDDTPEETQRNVEQGIPIYVRHHGAIMDLTASFQFIAFGVHGELKETCRDNSRAASKELLAECGENVRVVAFDGDMTYGNIGTDARMNYTVFVPKFDRCLAALLNTEFGCITELGSLPYAREAGNG
jgi:hypothetical protein